VLGYINESTTPDLEFNLRPLLLELKGKLLCPALCSVFLLNLLYVLFDFFY
jgi:hypothetical protein